MLCWGQDIPALGLAGSSLGSYQPTLPVMGLGIEPELVKPQRSFSCSLTLGTCCSSSNVPLWCQSDFLFSLVPTPHPVTPLLLSAEGICRHAHVSTRLPQPLQLVPTQAAPCALPAQLMKQTWQKPQGEMGRQRVQGGEWGPPRSGGFPVAAAAWCP